MGTSTELFSELEQLELALDTLTLGGHLVPLNSLLGGTCKFTGGPMAAFVTASATQAALSETI